RPVRRTVRLRRLCTDGRERVKRVLVTGATGFIGSHLLMQCEREGYAIRGLVRSPTARGVEPPSWEFVEGDVRDARAMKAAAEGIDIVFHLAGYMHAAPSRVEDESLCRAVNVDGTRNLLDGAVDAGVRVFVF